MKMAQKRAFVGAILIATGASEFFTQDIEDMEINGAVFSNDHPSNFEEAEVVETPATEPIPGHWYAKLEKCKTKQEIDELALKHQETLQANPELKQLFIETKKQLPNAA